MYNTALHNTKVIDSLSGECNLCMWPIARTIIIGITNSYNYKQYRCTVIVFLCASFPSLYLVSVHFYCIPSS